MTRSTLETYGGTYFDYTAPRAEDVYVSDLARALSNACRFAGHVSRFYSVAEHAALVAGYVRDAGHPELELAALHHDSHEAYLGDLPTPLKFLIGIAYYEMRDAIDVAVAEAIGVDPADFHHPAIVEADALALRVEARALKASRGESSHWAAWTANPTPAPDAPWRLGWTPPYAEGFFRGAHAEAVAARRAV